MPAADLSQSGMASLGNLMLESWALSVEAMWVVGLRTAKIGRGGPQAIEEASRMTLEKIGAAIDLQAALISRGGDISPVAGAVGAVRFYRKIVRANRRRLLASA